MINLIGDDITPYRNKTFKDNEFFYDYLKTKIKHKRKFKYYKKYIKEFENLNIGDNVKVAVITPDSDIVKDNNKLKPAYLVFQNYDRVLKWNRSLRFAIAVCTLKNKFEDEL